MKLLVSISVFNGVLQQFYRERRPAGLMARTAAASRFAVEVFVKKNEIAPVRVLPVFRILTMTRPHPVLVGQKNASKSAGQFPGYFLERSHVSGIGRALDLKRFAVKE